MWLVFTYPIVINCDFVDTCGRNMITGMRTSVNKKNPISLTQLKSEIKITN